MANANPSITLFLTPPLSSPLFISSLSLHPCLSLSLPGALSLYPHSSPFPFPSLSPPLPPLHLFPPSHSPLPPLYLSSSHPRYITVDWMVEIAELKNLSPNTLHLAVALFDHYLLTRQVDRSNLQLLGVTAILVASR